MELSPHQRAALLDLARSTIRRALSAGEALARRDEAVPLLPQDDDAAAAPSTDPSVAAVLAAPAGCFVTLHTLGGRRLRGCVGRLDADLSLDASLRAAARNVLSDPRFADDPVRGDELPRLELELSVISPLRPAVDVLAFDPANDGLYLTIGRRAGCFLPQVAQETGWGRQQLLERLCTEKLGLPADAWRGPQASLSVFSATVVGPEPFVPAASNT